MGSPQCDTGGTQDRWTDKAGGRREATCHEFVSLWAARGSAGPGGGVPVFAVHLLQSTGSSGYCEGSALYLELTVVLWPAVAPAAVCLYTSSTVVVVPLGSNDPFTVVT